MLIRSIHLRVGLEAGCRWSPGRWVGGAWTLTLAARGANAGETGCPAGSALSSDSHVYFCRKDTVRLSSPAQEKLNLCPALSPSAPSAHPASDGHR